MRPRFEPETPQLEIMLKEAKALEDRIAKVDEGSQPKYTGQKEGSTQGSARFEIQPSKVPNAFYNTNNTIPEVEVKENTGATSEKSNILDKPTQYPDAISDAKYRLNDKGDKKTVKKSLGGSAERMAVQDLQKSVDRLARRLN